MNTQNKRYNQENNDGKNVENILPFFNVDKSTRVYYNDLIEFQLNRSEIFRRFDKEGEYEIFN